MPIYRDRKSGQWRFDFDRRVNGQRVRRRQLLPPGWTRAQADAFDRQESAALYAIATGVARPRHHIDDAVTGYCKHRAPALKHGANVQRELEQMRDWWTGRALDQLPKVCAEYAADQEGALQPATIRNRIAYLRAACRWFWKRTEDGGEDPGARVVSPTVRNARDIVISRAEMVRLARACPHPGVRALIRIAWWSGMRVAEIQRAERLPAGFLLRDTKNGSPRIVPMHPIISTASRIEIPPRSVIDYWWPLARTAAQMPHVRLHDLRHAHASALASAGVDLATIGRILGHKSPASTLRYAHHSVERQAEAIALLRRAR
jgi:integrase